MSSEDHALVIDAPPSAQTNIVVEQAPTLSEVTDSTFLAGEHPDFILHRLSAQERSEISEIEVEVEQSASPSEASQAARSDAALSDPPAVTESENTNPPETQASPQSEAHDDSHDDDSEDSEDTSATGFAQFGLAPSVLEAVEAEGYTEATEIQQRTIGEVLQGRDLLAQAQTGTGKTAAFALPLLSRLRLEHRRPQVLVLAPTRELANQVAESFERYGAGLKGFRVLAVYGGQGYDKQLRQLKKGVHVVVGTPGRIMDHIRRETLDLSDLDALVLDEADEMLRMGFVDDVEWILEQCADERQLLFFSATMPPAIRKLSHTYLQDPVEVFTPVKNVTAETVTQKYWLARGVSKLEALQRFLEIEKTDGIIIFVRTRQDTVVLSEQLTERGYSVAPLNGDIPQHNRERTVQQLKDGRLEILVATDVAARGLDIERISHVINYDIPHDPEAYVHRIGRTGRAGREGQAILFVWPRERRLLKNIERVTKQKLIQVELPSPKAINAQRVRRFKQEITQALEHPQLDFYRNLLSEYLQEQEPDAMDALAAMAVLARGGKPLLMKDDPPREKFKAREDREKSRDGRPSKGKASRGRFEGEGQVPDYSGDTGVYRLAVGHRDRVRPGQIVGAIANEGGIDSDYIGEILLYETFATVELPVQLEKQLSKKLSKTRVAGRQLKLSRFDEKRPLPRYKPAGAPDAKGRKGHKAKGKKKAHRKGRKF